MQTRRVSIERYAVLPSVPAADRKSASGSSTSGTKVPTAEAPRTGPFETSQALSPLLSTERVTSRKDGITGSEGGIMPTPTRSRDQSPDRRPALDELIGLAGLLRAWRAAAGTKMRRSKPLSQAEVAARAGMTERWYGELERGASPRLGRPKIDQLAAALLLDEDQRETLYLYTDGAPRPAPPRLRDTPTAFTRSSCSLTIRCHGPLTSAMPRGTSSVSTEPWLSGSRGSWSRAPI